MDPSSGREDVFSLFDSSPSSFLWSPQRGSLVQAGRQPTGSLFFDDLISIAGVDGSLYPPQDILSLRRLLTAIGASFFDKLKKDCLVYYLLKDSEEGGINPRATSFAEERFVPSQFVDLTDGYWAMDNGLYELAVSRLSSISVKPDFTSKILLTLSKIPPTPHQLANPNVTSDSLSARLVLHFIRFARPTVESPQDVHIKLDALAKTSIREAWMYMRTFEEGEFRAGLIRRVFQFCLTPKPKPTPLQTLLAFPFTPFEDQTLSSLCLAPSTSPPLPTPSLTVLFDLANVRLVSQGRFAEAIKLDRAIGAMGQAAEKRRATILGLVRLLPEVQRRILELEMDEGRDEVEEVGMVVDGAAKKGKGKEAAVVVNGAGGDEDVEMGGLPASTSNGSSSSLMGISTSNANLPLSASQVLRTSSPQLAIHRAFIAPPSSPGPSSSPRPNQQPSTPGRVGQQSTSTAFAFQAPTSISSPRPLPFGDLKKSLFASKPSSPAPSFGRPQSPFAPSASSRPVDAGSPAPARGFAQQQPSSSQQHQALASSQPQREASPFAQAARQASALQRSTATPRGGTRLGSSTAGGTFRNVSQQQQPVASSSSVRSRRREVEDEEEEDRQSRETTPKKKHRDHHAAPSSSSRHHDIEMDDEEQHQPSGGRRGQEEDLTLSQLDHNPRRQQASASSSRTSTKKQPPPSSSTRSTTTTTTTTSSRRKPASSTAAKSAPTVPEVEPEPTSSPPPKPQPTRTSHRRTASQASNAALPPPPPPPAPTRASSRLATATTSAPSTRTTRRKVVPGAFNQEVDEEEEHADVVSSPPPPSKRAAGGRHNTRATSVVSDAGGAEEEESGAGRAGKRTTRGSVRGTVSPEAKKTAASKTGREGVRRSTRRG